MYEKNKWINIPFSTQIYFSWHSKYIFLALKNDFIGPKMILRIIATIAENRKSSGRLRSSLDENRPDDEDFFEKIIWPTRRMQ